MIALLTIIISFVGALLCGLTPAHYHRQIRWYALFTALLGLGVGVCCWLRYDEPGAIADMIEFPWIPEIGVKFILKKVLIYALNILLYEILAFVLSKSNE